MAKILIVLTSHTQLGETGKPTGFYFDELAAPYWVFSEAGHDVDLASIAGGHPQPDPNSLDKDVNKRSQPVQRFLADPHAQNKLENTIPMSAVEANNYDAIFLAGGHGAMWDFPDNEALSAAITRIYDMGGIVSAVCHGPAGLVNVKRYDGHYLVNGSRVNGFTNDEEKAVELQRSVPFLLEDTLKARGAKFESRSGFSSFAVQDGRLVTGQNPQSAEKTAKLVVSALKEIHREAA